MTERAELIQRRGRVKGTITRMKTFTESLNQNTTLEDIVIRLEKVDEVWAEFQAIEDCLLLIDNQASEMEEYEEKYFDIKASLTRAMKSRTPTTNNNNNMNQSISDQLSSTMNQFFTQQQTVLQSLDRSNSQGNIARLPKLNIPVFSGDYREWISFQDLFEASIHSNTSLTGAQKLQYLKGLLQGNAANVIRHLTISDNNYDEAWEKLKSRFNKKVHITTSLIKTFLDVNVVNQPGVKPLRTLHDTFDETLRGLKALGSEAEKRDPWLVYIGLTKLDPETRELWSQETTDETFPTFQNFLKFLSKRCDALEACGVIGKRPIALFKSLHTTSTDRPPTCPRCSSSHFLYKCEQFKAEYPENRRSFAAEKSLCFKCLGAGHSVRTCRSKMRCDRCNGNHHPLLHSTTPNHQRIASHVLQSNITNEASSSDQAIPDSGNSMPPDNVSNSQEDTTLGSFNTYIKNQSKRNVEIVTDKTKTFQPCLLPTVLANIADYQGKLQPCRMLLDSGSQVSLISESCIQRLQLKRENARLTISGLQTSCVGTTRGKTSLNIFSRWNEANIEVKAFVMDQLTGLIPLRAHDIPDMKQFYDIHLADPGFHQPSQIDVIIGADNFFEVLLDGKKYNNLGKPIAQKTIFGWVLFGNQVNSLEPATSLHTTLFDLDKSLRRFWEVEEVPHRAKSLTSEEQQCESHFKHNFWRTKEGRYTVALPFKPEVIPLGDSLQAAIKRLHAMERRFEKEPIFKQQYTKFMQEYHSMGHMELISAKELQPLSCFYLPHHAVFKNAPQTKIRVVFDGSCKSSSGTSLNDKLLVGPVVQSDLVSILLNFRRHRIAFSADIEKMYRQILVTSADRDFQRIVWREDPSQPLQHYKLTTVTYGTSCAPFLATRVLQQIANENEDQFPEASAIIKNDFYVDDLLSGCEDLPKAVRLKGELCELLKTSGFDLIKWCSNSPDLLKNDKQPTRHILINATNDTVKVLGVEWNPAEDTFSFCTSTFESGGVSKRIILSESSRIFDPLGWLAPVVIRVKILLQQLWLLKCGWDDQLPDEVVKRWESFKKQLPALQNIRIQRRIYITSNKMQLQGFSDASEAAFGAVVYCRSTSVDGHIITRIVLAKSRVAPLKQVSLPRLELCGALLLARLVERIKESLVLTNVPIYAWTDSRVVLAWLSDIPRRWKTYVANRTAEILEIIPVSKWRHVPSKSNPADLLTRGVSAQELPALDLWWNGPTWLSESSDIWPEDISSTVDATARKEEKKAQVMVCVQEAEEEMFLNISAKFSSFFKLTRVIAYCLRFAYASRTSQTEGRPQLLSVREITNAATVCFRCTQQSSFSSEKRDIKKEGRVSIKSPIVGLTPFLDDVGILRVGGRLEKSTYNFSAKHPIILPKNHPVTNMLIRELHKIYLHPGPSLLVGIIRQRYWILGVRDVVKRITAGCVVCFKQRAARTSQLMGDLPETRVSISRPFFNVGVDFAGPVILKTKSGRGAKSFKAYVALFVCMATRALHLEVVSGLSSEVFIAALRRFISRRGVPAKVFSDNGTNFVGGKRHLTEIHKLALSRTTNENISHFLESHKIEWSFIPPGAPHFGGLWEAGVKSVKWHLRRVIGETILTFEEMATLLTQIEAILNSRPYGFPSSSPEDLDALTPGHFLIGEPLTTLPDPDYSEVKITRLSRWQHIQSMVQGFWKRWRLEYLSSLQERSKWRQKQNSLNEGDLVIINEDNLPPCKWLMGRVVITHPGDDGLVRVVSLRTRRGILKRAINKVHKLPIS